MKPSQSQDLIDLSEILEGFTKKLEKLSEADMIDLAARLKPAAKMIDEIDKYAKDKLKHYIEGKPADTERIVVGGSFKAILKVVEVQTFQQKLFKEDQPKLAAVYTEPVDQIRISFDLR